MSATLLLKRHAKLKEKQALENAKRNEVMCKDDKTNCDNANVHSKAVSEDEKLAEGNINAYAEAEKKVLEKCEDEVPETNVECNDSPSSGKSSEETVKDSNDSTEGCTESVNESLTKEICQPVEEDAKKVVEDNEEETLEDEEQEEPEDRPMLEAPQNLDIVEDKTVNLESDKELDGDDVEVCDITEESDYAEKSLNTDKEPVTDEEVCEITEDLDSSNKKSVDLNTDNESVEEEDDDEICEITEDLDSGLDAGESAEESDKAVGNGSESGDALIIEEDETDEECEIVSDEDDEDVEEEEDEVISVDDSVDFTEDTKKLKNESHVSVIDLSSEPFEVVDLCSDEEEDDEKNGSDEAGGNNSSDSASNDAKPSDKECEVVNLDDSKEETGRLSKDEEKPPRTGVAASVTEAEDASCAQDPSGAKEKTSVIKNEKTEPEAGEGSSRSSSSSNMQESSKEASDEGSSSSDGDAAAQDNASQTPIFFEDRVGDRRPKKKKPPRPSRTVKKQKLSVVAYKVIKQNEEEGESRIEIPADDLSANHLKGGGPPRPIVIDGFSVALGHGKRKVFSSRGLKVCIDYFLKKGHSVKAILPRWRLRESQSSHFPTKDIDILKQLDDENLLVLTPSSCGFDNVCGYVLQYAVETGGVVVSDHSFQNIKTEQPEWEEIVDNRRLIPTWVDDMLIFPKDPLGQKGPSLEQFLQFEKTENFDDSDDSTDTDDDVQMKVEDTEVIDID